MTEVSEDQYWSAVTINYSSEYPNYQDYDESGGMCRRSDVRQFARYFLPPFYLVVFLLGSVGNVLVVVLYACNKRVKTMTDVYLLNLAVADLLFLCTLPFWALDVVSGWVFGDFMCKAAASIYKINFFSCILLLSCISVDRYIAIVMAVKARGSRRKMLLRSKMASLLVWLLAVILSLPELCFSRQDSAQGRCLTVYPEKVLKASGLAVQVAAGFFLPFAVMAFCYATVVWKLLRAHTLQRHRAIKVVGTVVAAFVLSQLPYNTLVIVRAMDAINITITDCQTLKNLDVATQVAQSVAFLHSCLNPLLYAFIGVKFRKDLLRILKDVGCAGTVKAKPQLGPYKTNSKFPPVHSETETTATFSL
ncbi:C-C chemokine receptor type 9-like [Amblyraja radiata]|uniref:C-C chemokine receptor type 9-like n=1 Tax=Amblyraja radiata TaxID=386614 RepID=UPI0014036490|nr:C-C chemokine receptor type 9-like [Amblyraja radiata]